jgi:hypothetical protein
LEEEKKLQIHDEIECNITPEENIIKVIKQEEKENG